MICPHFCAHFDLFYKIRDKINQIEALFYPQLFIVSNLKSKQEQVAKLQVLQKQYPYCNLCQKESNDQIALIQQSIDDEHRTRLFALQNQQLRYRKCFSDLQLKALYQLQLRYPNQDSLSKMELALFSAYLDKINQLESVANEFNQLSSLSIEKIPSNQLASTLHNYNNLLNSFANEACQLFYGELLKKEDLKCIDRGCRVAIP